MDVSSIQTAIELASKQTRGSLEMLLGYTAYYTAVRAQKYLPAADIQTIDASLDSTISMGGKPGNTMTVGQALILARMNPNSKFNQMTSNRWALQRPAFSAAAFGKAYGDPGMARRVFWEFVNNKEEIQRAAKHSSTHFLKAGWKAVKMKLKSDGFKLSGGDSDSGDDSGNGLSVAMLGDRQRGGQGTNIQWLRIENKIGMDQKYPRLAAEHNAALLDYGIPALNQALAEQAQWMRDKYLPRSFGEIEAAWNSVPNAGAFVPGTHTRSMAAAEDEAGAMAVSELETFT